MKKSIIFARMSPKDVELIKQVVELRGENLSNFVRRSVKMELARLSFLSEEEMKALGFTKDPSIDNETFESILELKKSHSKEGYKR